MNAESGMSVENELGRIPAENLAKTFRDNPGAICMAVPPALVDHVLTSVE